MQETAQQYTQRILGYLEGKEVLDVLTVSPRQVAKLVKGITKKRLSRRPSPEKWSVTEILAHLADVEIVQGFRIRLILGLPGVAIQGFDQDVWAKYSDYASHDPVLSLEGYRVNRERTLRLLKSLPRQMWDSYGMHSERGRETVKRVSEMMAGHDINHLNQIRTSLKG
jgi:DinB superfamily